MMMAHGSTPNGPELSASSLDELRSALAAFLRAGETATLHAALQRIAAEARAKKMRADDLLLQLKDIWFQLPEITRAPAGAEQERLLQRVLTLCIREYYADGAS